MNRSDVAGSVLEIEDLHVRIPVDEGTVYAVNGVSLRLRPGEVTALVGESGSGKSMTARAVLSVLPAGAATSGEILFGDQELLGAGERRLRAIRGAQIALVFQDASTSLSPLLTVGGHFKETLRSHHHPAARHWPDVAVAALERAGLDDARRRLGAYPFELSGGQQKRVTLGLAIALTPEVLLADEITTALDVTTQAHVLATLRSLAGEAGTAVLLITHDLAVAATWADDLSVMYGGMVVERGPADLVLSRPRHPYTAALVACQPRIDGAGEFEPIPGRAETITAPLSGCPFASRCSQQQADCWSAVPPLLGQRHAVACWHPLQGADR